MKKLVFLCIAACCLFGCQNAEKKAKQHGEAQIVQENGEKLTVEVELVNGKLRDVDIDETVEGKKQTKKELKEDYQMKQASSIGKEWYEQVAFFENYVEKKGIKDIKLNEEGKATNDDVRSGCTIAIDGFIKGIEEAVKNAEKQEEMYFIWIPSCFRIAIKKGFPLRLFHATESEISYFFIHYHVVFDECYLCLYSF